MTPCLHPRSCTQGTERRVALPRNGLQSTTGSLPSGDLFHGSEKTVGGKRAATCSRIQRKHHERQLSVELCKKRQRPTDTWNMNISLLSESDSYLPGLPWPAKDAGKQGRDHQRSWNYSLL
jgi:hypothetical protein